MQLSFPLDDDPLLPRVSARLRATASPRRDEPRRDPVSQLVRSMLGSKTRDEVSIQAFERLRDWYPSWDLLQRAPPRRIERAIWMVNHADRQAAQLPQALRMIVARSGALALDFLADWDEEVAMRWLVALPGVGPKIAASVLNFSTLRKRELVVDTHLLRVGERLGLLPARPDYETGHDGFMRLIPEGWTADDLYELHRMIKVLGQTVCAAQAPACGRCPLQELCPRCGC